MWVEKKKAKEGRDEGSSGTTEDWVGRHGALRMSVWD